MQYQRERDCSSAETEGSLAFKTLLGGVTESVWIILMADLPVEVGPMPDDVPLSVYDLWKEGVKNAERRMTFIPWDRDEL